MALQDTDLLVVNRGGTNYKVTVADFKQEISPLQGRIQNGLANMTNFTAVIPVSLGAIPFVSFNTAISVSTTKADSQVFLNVGTVDANTVSVLGKGGQSEGITCSVSLLA